LVLDGKATDHPFGAKRLWARRDQPKVLALVQAIALLYQHQREIKSMTTSVGEVIEYIEVSEGDWKIAEPFILYLMEALLSELPAPSRELLATIKRLAQERSRELSQPSGEFRFTRRDLIKATGWSYWQLRTYIVPLIEREYIWVYRGKRGQQEYVYELLAGE
jgi:hypothetical protein